MTNIAYTDLWIRNFESKDVLRYDQKFFNQFEKNIKHNEQIEFIRSFATSDMRWCDCPIGSGRLMRVLKTREMIGFDQSPSFIEHNEKLGIRCVRGDLFELPFKRRFDLITCIHTLFAFEKRHIIVRNLVDALDENGILILDIVNKTHIERTDKWGKYPYDSAMTKEEIVAMLEDYGCDVLKIVPHDYWDARSILRWRSGKGAISWFVNHVLWRILNFLYFKAKVHWIFKLPPALAKEHQFVKYLIAARKRPTRDA